ncbi:uncharacterized protein LOC112536879 [Ricinus communis]|uniref:Uncharacterized protein n=1 Tax=Ricinus communis TaxID=3988 RepID=B9T468_RICCO|nr:uncharacterized protein LOC112536879 [Ricinus communis]EEF29345.1 conserved hypothetical protein [Ricinus communis]|eukprot:XP_025015545.1 uncharacterized protein LOC112536879 [Ricinus communis]
MGRQNCDPTSIHSSIALLQERFRQLERAKEMRQQRELLRLFSEAEQVKPPKAFEQSRPFFHSELVLPLGQPLQDSLYLQPNMQNRHAELQINETPNSVDLWSKNTVMHITNNFDESDVDTSLHL